jgi:hypothetical protein
MRVTSSPRVKSAIAPDSSVTFLIACSVCMWRGGREWRGGIANKHMYI